MSELLTLQAEYAGWLAALPEGLHDSPTAQALEAIVELDLDSLADIDPPRGYDATERKSGRVRIHLHPITPIREDS